MRCPSSPGKGGLSNPGSARPSFTHIIVRGMMINPGRCYVVLYSEYYKIACRMSNSTPPPRIIFLGIQGIFAHPPLRAVLEAVIDVCAVVVPAAHGLVQH